MSYQARVKTWVAGETLYAADLNAEFDAIIATLIPDPSGATRGDILYRGATTWGRLAAGTADYVLTSNGPGADPSWQVSATGVTDPLTTQGDIMYRSDSATTRLPAGTAGMALTTGGGSANPAWAGMTTKGDVEYHNGTTRTRLAAGTAGQALTTGGAGANASFAGMTTGGDLEYHNGTTRTRLAKGTALYVLRMNSGGTAPEWAEASVADASVSQAKLKTSQSSVSTSTAGAILTLPGGEYGFFPQLKSSSVLAECFWGYDVGGEIGYRAAYTTSESFVTVIGIGTGNPSVRIAYAQQRYVTSSGEVFWIFFMTDKSTGNILHGCCAPDHPCFGNGNDPLLIEHPFNDYDPSKHEIVVINPTNEEVKELKEKCKSPRRGVSKKLILDLFYHTRDKQGEIIADPLYKIDNVEMEYPKIPVTIGIANDDLASVWWKAITKEPAEVIKTIIPQPEYVKPRGLKKNGVAKIY